MMKFAVRKFRLNDLDCLSRLEQEAFLKPQCEKSLQNELVKENFLCLVAENEQYQLIGYISAYFVLDECYIINLAVTASMRRRGVGSALINNLFEIAEHRNFKFVTLEVRVSNFQAISLYEKLGFEKQGIRKNYYSRPIEDAILMTKFFVVR